MGKADSAERRRRRSSPESAAGSEARSDHDRYFEQKSSSDITTTMTRFRAKYAEEFNGTFSARVASGEIKYKEHRVLGLENAGHALVDVLTGGNFGKSVLIVAEE